MPKGSRKSTILRKLLLCAIASIAGLAVLEFASRLIMPVTWMESLTLDGDPTPVYQGPYRLIPNLTFRQLSQDYDCLATTTSRGHRAPAVEGSPEVIFLGDSFTFGLGVTDEQTFVHLFARDSGLSCVNLARPGTGTGEQIDILEHFLGEEKWRPKNIKLCMAVMTDSLLVGNDLADTLIHSWRNGGETRGPAWYQKLSDLEHILPHSNLARVFWYCFAPRLRIAFSKRSSQAELAEALRLTEQELLRLARLSGELGFSYEVIIIHPLNDIMNNTHGETERIMKELIQDVPVRSTAYLYEHAPMDFYYPYDAHLNPKGHVALAGMLVAGENSVPEQGAP
ncbi:MAG: SGNH/GDSL hydrolase family protein [Kiritimatiellia bacterium]|jgi:hypothetical protein|nr:SGNH/GDSL hydrolase family protein [Kiritimatiellia bacterium]